MTSPIEQLAWAIVRRRAVTRRLAREGHTAGALEADREVQCELAAAIGRVHHEVGSTDEAFAHARAGADQIEERGRVLCPAAFE